MQGMLRPFTPMGMSAMRVATAQSFRTLGIPADPFDGHPGVVDSGRAHVPRPDRARPEPRRSASGCRRPCRSTGRGCPRRCSACWRIRASPRAGPAVPAAHRARGRGADRARPRRRAGRRRPAAGDGARCGRSARPRRCNGPADRPHDLRHRGRAAALRDRRPGRVHRGRHAQMLPPIYAAMFARAAAVALLAGRRRRERDRRDAARDAAQRHHRDGPGPVAARGGRRGAPRPAAAHPARRARRPVPRRGRCPRSGSTRSCAGTGTAARPRSTSVCRAGPRTPRPVFAAIAGYLRVTDPEQGPGPPLRPGRRGRGREDRRAGRAGAPHPTDPGPVRRLPAAQIPRHRRPARAAQVRLALRVRRDAQATARRRRRTARARPAGPARRHHVPRPPRGPRRGGGRRRPPGAGRRPPGRPRARDCGAATSPASCSPTAPIPETLTATGPHRRRDAARDGGRTGHGDRPSPGDPRPGRRARRAGRDPGGARPPTPAGRRCS